MSQWQSFQTQQEQDISLHSTLSDYFRERLQDVSQSIDPKPQQDTLFYVGEVMARFARTEQLYSFENNQLSLRPLALLYKDALETSEPRQRELFLRQLGDMALFLGALFPQRYAKKGIGRDYFVGMGSAAYDYLAAHALQFKQVFAELSGSIARFIEIIADICARENPFDASDILALYKRYQQTGDANIAKQLQSLGVSVAGSTLRH
uniref:hypothetical protein n=1 Tax=Ningiella ruwaisensis TaxID=2364274 RepID=UPI00109F342B|nr:hypothetical protein [Ningiella ruwaisensis]